MKKVMAAITVFLIFLLLVSGCAEESVAAIAQTSEPQTNTVSKTVTGTVETAHTCPVTAPFSGTLLAFDIKNGDMITKGDPLFTIDTVKVYAPFDGIARGVQVGQGDNAEAVQVRYGALCYIEPENLMIIHASINGAYDRDENKIIHIGETLYARSRSNKKIVGSGVVISISGNEYDVELKTGAFEMDESVYLFRESDYQTKGRVGEGIATRSNPIPITTQGTVVSIYVSEGKHVAKGDLLFELAGGIIDPDVETKEVLATQSGVLGDIIVSAGQSVQKGQLLASIYETVDVQVISSVDEMDLGGLSRGDIVSIVLDSMPSKSYEGIIEGISELGEQKQNATYYDIYISFSPDTDAKLGMSATVYLPES